MGTEESAFFDIDGLVKTLSGQLKDKNQHLGVSDFRQKKHFPIRKLIARLFNEKIALKGKYFITLEKEREGLLYKIPPLSIYASFYPREEIRVGEVAIEAVETHTNDRINRGYKENLRIFIDKPINLKQTTLPEAEIKISVSSVEFETSLERKDHEKYGSISGQHDLQEIIPNSWVVKNVA